MIESRLEKLPNTLSDLIKKKTASGLPESDVRRLARSIVRGLNHIHGCSYVYYDKKSEEDVEARVGPSSSYNEASDELSSTSSLDDWSYRPLLVEKMQESIDQEAAGVGSSLPFYEADDEFSSSSFLEGLENIKISGG
ncbi:hypothetical protein F0562_024521 [Nyssa sinensis]|uniref:Protein kinase domain-containing protein n=1 Tax=Nyssa sinensis TaxID=561372 RepID=A0A5J5BDX8_9ASTE|nr:hypothetical protein F0562_024521 [Nyssa sinensis]